MKNNFEVAEMGYIMQLQNLSVNDGDGIRTNIFLAGCPLRCAWCANPEGQTTDNPMVSQVSADWVESKINKQIIFYRNSGGGVTFSGGEATAQVPFLRELTRRFYDKGLSIGIETCGYFDFEEVKDILEMMDIIFYDIKVVDEDVHKKYTGVGNKLIFENLQETDKLAGELVVRIPVVRGVNDTDENMEGTFDLLNANAPSAKLEFLPYHSFGTGKYEQLGLMPPSNEFAAPSAEQIAHWTEMAQAKGIEVVSYR